MPCDELVRLRAQASTIKKQIDAQRKKARAKAAHARSGRPSGKSEYVPYLTRKLQRIAQTIERHMAEHRCQE